MQEEVRRDDESSTDCIELTVKYLPGVFFGSPPSLALLTVLLVCL